LHSRQQKKAGIPHSNREIKLLGSSFDDTFGTRNTGRQNSLFTPTAACSNPPGFTMPRALAKIVAGKEGGSGTTIHSFSQLKNSNIKKQRRKN
jgi:hypothetical protein